MLEDSVPGRRLRTAYLLTVLTVLNFFNYGTRTVLFPMYEDLRNAFALSNSEIGLLSLVFMLSHALATIPIGWAADRLDRRRVMAAGACVWGMALVGSAFAQGFVSLAASRALAGIGTASCVPVANAFLCDAFPHGDKARTISVFNAGLFLGGAAGFGVGALLGFPFGFAAVAIPTLAWVVAVYSLPEVPHDQTREPVSWGAFARDIFALWSIPTLRWVTLAALLMAFAAGGVIGWFADFVAATKAMSIERATIVFGSSALTGGLAGVLTGGALADYLHRRRSGGRLITMSSGFSAAIPFMLLSIFVDSGPLFYAGTWLSMFFLTWYHGPLAALVDDLVAEERAATAQAVFVAIMHLFGTAPSFYAVGRLADWVGLRWAMLAPVAAISLAVLATLPAWRSIRRDLAGQKPPLAALRP